MAIPVLTGTSSTAFNTFFSTTLTWSHTTNGNPLLVLASTDSASMTHVTFGGVRLELGERHRVGDFEISWWYLMAPGTATANIVINCFPSRGLAGQAFNVQNVDFTIAKPNTGTNTGTGTAVTGTVVSGANSLVLDCVVSNVASQTWAEGAGQTAVNEQVSAAGNIAKQGTSTKAGASPTVTTTCTLGLSDTWSILLLSLDDPTVVATEQVSQTVIETVNTGSSIVQVGQAVVEVVTTVSAPQQVSQAVVEVVTLVPFPPPEFTKLYLTAQPAPYTPATLRGAWDQTASSLTCLLSSEKLYNDLIDFQGISETNIAALWDVLLYRGVSGPIGTQTFSGTVNVCIPAYESNAAADFYWHVHIYVTQGNSDTPRGTLLSDYVENTTNEWSTTTTARAFISAQALAAIGSIIGDRIVAEIGYISRNAVTTSRQGGIYYGTSRPFNLAPGGDLTVGDTANVTLYPGFIEFSSPVLGVTLPERLAQASLEIANRGSSSGRIGQVVLEMAAGHSATGRIGQMLVEVASGLATPQRISQLLLEVASTAEDSAGQVNSVWMGDGASSIWTE